MPNFRNLTQWRHWYAELTKVLLVVVIVGTVVWGISRADTTQEIKTVPKIEAFSLSGLVSSVSDTSFSIDNIKGSDNLSITSYTFDTSTVQKIESNEDTPLQLSDVKIGDKIVVQGTFSNDVFTAIRIIDFASAVNFATTTTASPNATSTATTTTDIISTSTDDIVSSTDETISSTTTSSFIDSVIDAVKDTIQNIVDAIIGTTTPDAITADEIATTTPEVVQDVSSTTSATTETPVTDAATST